MKITAVETLQAEAFANLVWVRLHTDEGLVGIGETLEERADTIFALRGSATAYGAIQEVIVERSFLR